MTDCANDTMRDLLPLLAHDVLDEAKLARVREHVATCAACTLELQLLTSAAAIFAAATPVIDTSAILAKLPTASTVHVAHVAHVADLAPSAPSARPLLTVERGARSANQSISASRRTPRYAIAAAASLLLMVTLSVAVLRSIFSGAPAAVDIAVDSGLPATPTVPVDLVGAEGLRDLGADELQTLLAELETMTATVSAEPSSTRTSSVGATTGGE